MSSKRVNQSLSSSIASKIFRKKSSNEERRGSTDSTGFRTSKSADNLAEVPSVPWTIDELKDGWLNKDQGKTEEKWEEVDMIKSLTPHVVCILPSLSVDFVASCLYAIGANPLIPEDEEDVNHLISDCKAIMVDVSAKQSLVETFIEEHIPGMVPLVVVVSNCGTDDRKKKLARQLIEKCEPTLVTGRLGDICALGQDIVERADGIIDNQDEIDLASSTSSITAQSARKSPVPPTRRSKSPVTSPRIQKKEAAKKALSRTKTPVPHLLLKGQFRHQAMKEISVPQAIESGRQLSAHHSCFVHMFEVNTVTCGEFFIELNNSQLGMDNLHSVVQCAAGITTVTLACVEEKGVEITLIHCSHGLAIYHVAAELGSSATNKGDFPPAGSLRVCFIDYLQHLDENLVKTRAQIVKHNEPPSKQQ